jgi:hypothetical protein
MGEMTKPSFALQDASIDDLQDIAEIFFRAMAWDPLAKAFDAVAPFELQVQWKMLMDQGRMTLGQELGACKTWKVVDENGYAILTHTYPYSQWWIWRLC